MVRFSVVPYSLLCTRSGNRIWSQARGVVAGRVPLQDSTSALNHTSQRPQTRNLMSHRLLLPGLLAMAPVATAQDEPATPSAAAQFFPQHGILLTGYGGGGYRPATLERRTSPTTSPLWPPRSCSSRFRIVESRTHPLRATLGADSESNWWLDLRCQRVRPFQGFKCNRVSFWTPKHVHG